MARPIVRILDRLSSGTLIAAGLIVALTAFAIFYYLSSEGAKAFDRKFTYGYRFAGWPATGEHEAIEVDPQATVLASHADASDELDDKEDGITMPTLDEVAGVSKFITGSVLPGADRYLTREQYVASAHATKAREMPLYFSATPEYTERTMKLAWAPDIDFEPNASPYTFTLKLVKGPPGVSIPPIDLKKQPRGEISIPTAVAATDDDRTQAYEFVLLVGPASSNAAAVLKDFFLTTWSPLVSHQRFGVMPLLLSTLLMTGLALIVAFPIAISCALYLREIAKPRLRSFLKPFLELLSSVPTVVLGFVGLMMVAPSLQSHFAGVFRMESGRSLLTASVILAVLLIPILTTILEDAIDRLPNSLRDAVDGLGLTESESLLQVIVPAARGGLIGAAMFGFARAVGETMIIWMLSGGTPTMPRVSPEALGTSTRGMADTIGIEMGNVDFGGVHYGYLFLLGLTLFLVTLAFNSIGYQLIRRMAWRH